MTGPSAARAAHDDDRPAGRQAARTRAHPDEATSERPRQGGLVLLADDSFDAREMYGMFLRLRGFDVQVATDGGAAIDMAIALRPDLIVMDLAMPVIDGLSAIERLRLNPRTREIPIILLTGFPQRAIERGALLAGADLFLTKPCLPEDLERHVRRLLESKRQ